MVTATRFPLGAAVTLEQLAYDPHPVLARLRASEPVSWVPALGAWLVTTRHLAIEVLRDPSVYTVDDPRFTTSQVVGTSMLSTDGAEHQRHRRPFAPEFRSAAPGAAWVADVRDRARQLLHPLVAKGGADLRSEFAAPLAVMTVVDVLGLRVDVDVVLGWYRSIVESVTELSSGSVATDAGREAAGALADAVSDAIDRDPSSMLSRIAAAGMLTTAEVASNAAVIMFGAIETSEGAIANAFHHLLTSGRLDTVEQDRGLLTGAVEESLRLEPAAAQVDRYTTVETRLGSVDLDAGDYVVVSIAGANRDPTVFSDPDAYVPTRPNVASHLTFVQGPHACLGVHLARVEIAAAIEAVLDAVSGLERRGEVLVPVGLVFRKPPSVEVEWVAR